MTKVDKIKEVRQLRYVGGLPIREIMRRMKLARNTVRRILRSNATEFTYQREETPQPVTGPIRDILSEWVKEDLGKKKKQRRTAARIYDILKSEHGYTGSYVGIAKCVQELKAAPDNKASEVYIPLIYSPGEAFQFDWGEVEVYINGELTTVQIAVINLCYSRHFYVRAYPCQKQELMLDAHQRAFEYFGGVCKRGIYDNLKTAVKKVLKGRHRNLQERFIQFNSHYLYEPQFCNPARGNEKGQVENLIGYLERNFFIPIPSFSSLEELNSRLISFAISRSRSKPHPEFPDKNCYEIYEKEKDQLIQLPGYNFECCRVQHSIVSPLSTATFDNNRYSVPVEYSGNIVMVKGNAEEVFIIYAGQEIARHKRCFGFNQLILNPYHYLGVLAKKPWAIRNGLPFKDWALPEIFNTYRQLLKEKFADSDVYFARTLVLLKDWPIKEVIEAIQKAISFGILGDSYILSLLKQKTEPEIKTEFITIKIELERYRASQKQPDYYDEILRFKSREGVKTNG